MMTFYGIPPTYTAGLYTVSFRICDPFGGCVLDPFDLKVNAKPAVPTSGLYGKIDKEFRTP
jgi:hypothetical protein